MKKLNVRYLKYICLILLVGVIFTLHSSLAMASCTPYCCGGQDGLGAPDPGPGQTSTKDSACVGPSSTRWACYDGQCECRETPPEKGYHVGGSLYCCTPYYLICTPDEPFTVTIDGNGGTCTPGTHTVTPNSSSSSQTCSRTGYTFIGFTNPPSGCGGTFNSSTGVCSKVTGDMTIQANWTCTPISQCNCSPLSSSSTSYGSKTVTCSNGCGGTASSTCWCTSNCTPQSCPSGTSESGTHGTYATYTCTNECNKSNSRTCKCTSACTPTSCPTGTTETNTGDSYSSYSCTNACSESQTRNCYCTICTPASCSSSGYSDTDLGCGQVSNTLTPSCRNGQGAPDQLSKCDMTYRTCYLPKYTITTDGNGGTCSPLSQSKCSGTASGAVTCTRAGYTFSGFTITSGSCGGTFNTSTGVCSSVTRDITIKANWSINSYYV